MNVNSRLDAKHHIGSKSVGRVGVKPRRLSTRKRRKANPVAKFVEETRTETVPVDVVASRRIHVGGCGSIPDLI
jgi:hypothetical protein